MYEVKSQQVDLLVTPEHRMWVKPYDTQANRRGEEAFAITEARSLLHRRVQYRKAPIGQWRGGQYRYKFSVPGVEDSRDGQCRQRFKRKTFPAAPFLRFLGYYLSEGHIGSDGQICLTQNPGPVYEKMWKAVQEMGLHPYVAPSKPNVIVTRCRQLQAWLQQLGLSHEKHVPERVKQLSPTLLSGFLEAYIEGDGSVHAANGHRVIYTTSRRMADDLQEVLLKTGVSANIRVDDRVGLAHVVGGSPVISRHPCYIVSIHQPSSAAPLVNAGRKSSSRYWNEDGYHDRMTTYAGRVYCVKTENGLLFVRRSGKVVVSGNTHELVRHRVGTAISQESLRYVRLEDLGMWVPPCFEGDDFAVGVMKATWSSAEAAYRQLLHAAARKEGVSSFDDLGREKKKTYTSAARRVLPIGLSTNIGWSCNMRTLRHLIEMRTDPSAEEEIRYVFNLVAEIAKIKWPALFGDYEIAGAGGWVGRNRKV